MARLYWSGSRSGRTVEADLPERDRGPDRAMPYHGKASPSGTTGFDEVGSCGGLQVEDVDGLVKNRQKPIRADHEFALAA